MPTELVANTVNEYVVLAVNPLTVIEPEPAVDTLPVIELGVETAVYEVIVALPLDVGAVYDTVAELYVPPVTTPIVGVPGTPQVLTLLDVALVAPNPAPLTA